MALSPSDRDLVVAELGREPTRTEEALFENLWSEHCAYRSSQPLLSAFDADSPHVVVGPGDDAAVVAIPETSSETEGNQQYVTLGIESHNHPSYVDPFDGAATGVGGIVRDTMSMGAYPIALADCLYFGPFDREHSRYLFEGVVEGISHYGNCIGVPTVTGSVAFHEAYEGNPLVNVACIGLLSPDRLVTAVAQTPGNKLVLVGNATGRDGLGGASFASEDLSEDAETEDRPAVQVGDPYAEKRLIEANEAFIEAGLVESARDLGAAGLGGASAELVAKGGVGAAIRLEDVHQREPGMAAVEILLAESQERMCYEVQPSNVARIRAIAEKFDLGCSVIGEITDGAYQCTFHGETVVDCDAAFLADGAPMHELEYHEPSHAERDVPTVDVPAAVEMVLSAPNTASKTWVYRQYDFDVGTRTVRGPGDDAAVLAIREAGVPTPAGATTNGDTTVPDVGLAYTAGADPNWTAAAPYAGARATALENAINLAVAGARPLAAVDCLNGGNPENPSVYGGFRAIVDGLADMCRDLGVPVVGGNVSLYNDSSSGPIPPTPTVAMIGSNRGISPPPTALAGDGDLLLVDGSADTALGGSEFLSQVGGSDRFPALPAAPDDLVEAIATIASFDSTLATHDVSHGGVVVTLAEMVDDAGVDVQVDPAYAPTEWLFSEAPGRVIVETTDVDRIREAVEGVASVHQLGAATGTGDLNLTVGSTTLTYSASEIVGLRDVIANELE